VAIMVTCWTGSGAGNHHCPIRAARRSNRSWPALHETHGLRHALLHRGRSRTRCGRLDSNSRERKNFSVTSGSSSGFI
jgi:Predicted membrane protein (DUF2207).